MKKTIKDYDLENKKVIIRCDFNVPIKNNEIVDDNRIKESLPTIKYALDNNSKVILLSHLGRIKEENDKKNNSLNIVAKRLSELLKHKVIFVNETRGETLESVINNMNNKDIVLIQNTRYEDYPNKLESGNDTELGKYWANLGDIFINDAFGTIHRAHASNVGIASNLPSGVGFLVEKELTHLSLLDDPDRPYTVILGGAKVSDKIGVIETLANKADNIIIGGAMAFTFLKAKGFNIGKSKVEEDYVEFASKMLKKYPSKIILPIDVVVAKDTEINSESTTKKIELIENDEMGLDLGKETIKNIKSILNKTKTVVWNGPLGYYELEKYQTSTKELLKYLTENDITTILGGGDIVAAATTLGYKDKVTHASTGGGATLEYLEGKILPGLEKIQDK